MALALPLILGSLGASSVPAGLLSYGFTQNAYDALNKARKQLGIGE